LAILALMIAGLMALTGCTPAPIGGPSSGVDIPNSAVGMRASWAIDLLNSDDDVTAGELEGAVNKDMAEALPPQDLADFLNDLRASRPWTPTTYDENEGVAVLRVESPATDPLTMTIAVDDAGLVSGLRFAAVAAEREPATSWDELASAVERLPAETTFTVSRLSDDDAIESIFTAGDTGAKPIGSMVKLWVLAAVAEAVERGDLSWDSEVTVTDDRRSLPSGELQDEPAGTKVTVEDAALKMISVSDNTAMDLLIDIVGRGAVEQTFAELGQEDPGLNVPLLTTREMFQVGWSEHGALRETWQLGDDEVRQAVIDGLPGGPINVEPQDVADPAWQWGVDWFASAHDLVLVHAGLQERAEAATGAPVRRILGANPGLDFGDEWSYVAFKGGSVAGVLGGSWLLERQDGERYVITMQAASNDPAAVSDIAPYFGLVQDAAALLSAQ
jgi:beta-lactamase class A